MRPAALKKLISMQNARIAEMQCMHKRVNERARETLNAGVVASRIESVRAIWSEARTTHVEIIAVDGVETDGYVTDNVFSNLQAVYEDTLDNLLNIAAHFEKEISSNRPHQEVQNSGSRPAKLPKIDLPTFSGKYEDWESFSDLFASLVHNVLSIEDSTKLHYLKSCLTGSAADLVKDVATTSANYASTWDALKARFYNPRITVGNHINALLNLPYLKRESAAEMRSFVDESLRIVRALSNLKMPIQHWDVWFVHIISSRLDPESRKLWESELSAKERAPNTCTNTDYTPLSLFPTFAELTNFLEKRSYALSMISYCADNKSSEKIEKRMFPGNNKSLHGSRRVFHASTRPPYRGSIPKCPLCSGSHAIGKCPEFMAKTPYARRADIRHLRLCYNCLGRHKFKECPSSNLCNVCRGKHHSLIHFDTKAFSQIPQTMDNKPQDEKTRTDPSAQPSAGTRVHMAKIAIPEYSVVLATAQVKVLGPRGNETRVRALLDQGSEGSFVSESTAQLLALPKERVNIPLTGVGGNSSVSARAKTKFVLQSITNATFNIEIEALVLPRLTSHLPSRNLVQLDLRQFTGLALADPQFHISDSVDLILGADVYTQLLRPGLQRFPTSLLIAQDTALGWILSGAVENITSRRAEQKAQCAPRNLHSAVEEPLHAVLERFWTLEESPETSSRLTSEEQACEKSYTDTHKRMEDGRYVVRLPLKPGLPHVGTETRRIALGSLNSIHHRFLRDPALALAYREFMMTYENLGHMSRVPKAELHNPSAWHRLIRTSRESYGRQAIAICQWNTV